MKPDATSAGRAVQRTDSGRRSTRIKRVEKQRSQLLYFAIVLMLILGIGVVVYAFSFELLGSLFSSDYFNNVVRFSFATLLVMTVVYLIAKERNYTTSFDSMVEELETNMEGLKGSLEDVNNSLKISRMVAVSDDLHERLEQRFPGMQNHWKRVVYYAAETARKMELDDDYVRLIEKAGELMDIGMLCFGDEFRAEAAELNSWEKEMVRCHPVNSVDILSSVRSEWEILPLVRHHHEWWNGNGYPDGLKGEAIPLGARILHVADAFVAMISYRPYQGTREARDALEEIGSYANVKFDPRVVQSFMDLMAPRVFADIDSIPVDNTRKGKRFIHLTSRRALNGKGSESGGNGTNEMDALEIEELLREIGG